MSQRKKYRLKTHFLNEFHSLTLYPSWNMQSQMRSTVSVGSTSANRQISHFVDITAHGRPHVSRRSLTKGARCIINSRSTAVSTRSPSMDFVWYDRTALSRSVFSSQNVHSSFLVTSKMRPRDDWNYTKDAIIKFNPSIRSPYIYQQYSWDLGSSRPLCYGGHMRPARWTAGSERCGPRKRCCPETYVVGRF